MYSCIRDSIYASRARTFTTIRMDTEGLFLNAIFLNFVRETCRFAERYNEIYINSALSNKKQIAKIQ